MTREDDKQLHIFVQRPGNSSAGVSRALWPANSKRIVPTGRAAQRRRSLLIKLQNLRVLQNAQVSSHKKVIGAVPQTTGYVDPFSLEKPKQPGRFALSRLSPGVFLCALVVPSMVSGGLLVVVMLWRLWYLLPLPILLLLTPFALLAACLSLQERTSASQTPFVGGEIPASLPWRSFPGLYSSPETPMPDPPSLVRVLETFDLSRSEVEHFLSGNENHARTTVDFTRDRQTGMQQMDIPRSRLGEPL